MAKNDSQNPGQGDAPSADEIIEALAQEMGVDEAKEEPVGEAEPEVESEPAAAQPEPVKAEAEPAVAAEPKKKAAVPDLGGIFDVPTAGEPKKAKAKKTAADAAPTAAKAKSQGVEGIFNVGKGGDAPAPPPEVKYDPIVDDDEPIKTGGGTVKLLVAVIVALILAMVVGGLFITGKFEDVVAVADGTYRDKMDAEKRRIEEENRKKMLEALKKYGTLDVRGAPDKALVRMQFDGDAAPRIVYAPFSENSPFTELRLPTTIQNLSIDKPVSILVAAPGYNNNQLTVKEESWQERSMTDYVYSTTMYLEAQSGMQDELIDRLEPHDEDFYGKLVIESNPPGAFIKINGIQVFKGGAPVRTPATITEYPVLEQVHVDAVTAEARTAQQLCDKGSAPMCEEAEGLAAKAKEFQEKLAERKKKPETKLIKINTPPDIGDKIDLWFADSAMPRYVTTVWRRLWICDLKPENEIARLPKDAKPIAKCDYVYRVAGTDVAQPGQPAPSAVADFEAIKVEIQRRKAIELEMEQQAAERERLKKEAEEALKQSLGK